MKLILGDHIPRDEYCGLASSQGYHWKALFPDGVMRPVGIELLLQRGAELILPDDSDLTSQVYSQMDVEKKFEGVDGRVNLVGQ